jgi:hypothetical protein
MFSVVFQFARNVFEERNTNNMNQIIWREQRQYSEGYVAYTVCSYLVCAKFLKNEVII